MVAVGTVLCGTRETIQWYCIISMSFHLGQLVLAVLRASDNVDRLLFEATVVTVEIIMQVYLFVAMVKYSRRMLRVYLNYLRVWAVLSVVYGLICLIGFLVFNYDFRSIRPVDRPRKDHKHRTHRSFELKAFVEELFILEAAPTKMHVDSVKFVLLVLISVTFEVVYAAFLYWRLRIFYRTMPDDGTALRALRAGGTKPLYGIPAPPGMPLQYVMPPPAQGEPYPGPGPVYGMASQYPGPYQAPYQAPPQDPALYAHK